MIKHKKVKNFIEYNIDLIDREEWSLLFTRTLEELDVYEISELIDIIEEDLQTETKTIREELFVDLFVEVLEQSFPKTTFRLRDILNDYFYNNLGFNYDEIINILDKNSFNLNIAITCTTTGEYIVEII